MIKKWLTRAAVTAGVGIAFIAGTTSPAHAADTNIDLVYDWMLVGEMRHVDDGDKFRVYDWYADGHGVKGTLQIQHPVTRQWSTITSKYNNTGSGSYVEFQHDVVSISRYRLIVCLQDGASDPTPIACDNKTFTE